MGTRWNLHAHLRGTLLVGPVRRGALHVPANAQHDPHMAGLTLDCHSIWPLDLALHVARVHPVDAAPRTNYHAEMVGAADRAHSVRRWTDDTRQ